MATKMRSRTPWRIKLEHPSVPLPKIVPVPPKWRYRFGTGTIAIPRPLDVDALVRTVKKGRVVTQAQLRQRLARKYGADHACPLTTGIFMRIVSEVAEEDRRAGKRTVTPYWRVLRDDGGLNEKFPGGARSQARRLRREGLSIAPAKGRKPPHVREFEQYLAHM